MKRSVRWTKEQLTQFQARGTIMELPRMKNDPNDRYKNPWEREFDKSILYVKMIRGEIYKYAYEPCNFRLAKNTYIRPDFIAALVNGQLVVYEVKGFRRDKWIAKWKIFKEQYYWMFDAFYIAEKINGVWQIREG